MYLFVSRPSALQELTKGGKRRRTLRGTYSSFTSLRRAGLRWNGLHEERKKGEQRCIFVMTLQFQSSSPMLSTRAIPAQAQVFTHLPHLSLFFRNAQPSPFRHSTHPLLLFRCRLLSGLLLLQTHQITSGRK